MKPPSTAMIDSVHAPLCGGALIDRRKNGIVTALAHRIELPTLASMKARCELISSATARTVQMLARWVAKPRIAASATTAISAGIASLLPMQHGCPSGGDAVAFHLAKRQ